MTWGDVAFIVVGLAAFPITIWLMNRGEKHDEE